MKRRVIEMSDSNIKVRKLGESKFFPIPESITLQADSYNVYQNEEGIIIYVPKKNNPFKNLEVIEKYQGSNQKEEIGNSLIGKEL
jgi:ATP sulfurylase